MKDQPSEGDCKCYLLCGLFKILFAHFLCRCCCCCCCCKVSNSSNRENTTEYEIKDWADFCKNETIPIAQSDLNDMKQNYINSQYSHKFYCFQKPKKRCSHSQCFHYETIFWKGFMQHPVLYLLILNFDKAKKKYKKMNVSVLKQDNKVLTWEDEENKALDFIFKIMFEKTHRNNKDFRNIKDRLENKINNICLVIEGFPHEYRNDFKDEENFIIRTILSLRQYYKVPLIYSVR